MKKALKWINAGAFLAMVAVNALANLLPIGGKTTGQVSEAYPNLFTPAPITFMIWGLIYLMLLVFTVYQFGILDRGEQSPQVREKIGLWFCSSCVLNILWIFFWHNQLIGLSTICIILLLITLNVIVSLLREIDCGPLQHFTTDAAFSLYDGWIIAATIANISVYLTQRGWNGWGVSPDVWTIVVLLVGAVIASAAALIRNDRIIALAVMWAYAGILIRHISPSYLGGAHSFVIAAAIVSEVLILAAILLSRLLPHYQQRGLLPACCGTTRASDQKERF